MLVPAVGQPVEVTYDPQRPKRAVVASVARQQNNAMLFIAVISFALAVTMILAAVVMGPHISA